MKKGKYYACAGVHCLKVGFEGLSESMIRIHICPFTFFLTVRQAGSCSAFLLCRLCVSYVSDCG